MVQFVEPAALLFSGLLGVLVLFYLWERWRRRVVVPSLLLWEAVREDTIRARRFRPDLLFLLQLLLLASLIVGLARPYWRNRDGGEVSNRHIFVLDTTASMQAREQTQSRFEAARDQALNQLRGLSADDEVMLITAAHRPEVVVGFTRDHASIEKALRHSAPTDTGGNLAVALAFTESLRRRDDLPTSVDVFTDVARSQLPQPWRETVRVFQVGESDANLAIEGLQVYQGRFQDFHGARAYVRVQNFSHREGHGFLTVRLEDHVVNRSGFTIPPRDSRGFLVHDFPGPGRVVAQLEAADALEVDNVAYGWIRPVTHARLLLVSAPSPLANELRELVAATPALELQVVRPEDFRPEQAQQATVTIFHRVVPAVPPPTNALYIYPPADNPLFPASGNATNVEVLDWNAHHAALQSLRPLASLPLQRVRIVSAPDWSATLLWSRTTDREFPLAFAGEHDGLRVACITFDLEAERLLSADNVNFFLFFMNLLSWLTPEQLDAAVVHTGEVYAFGQLPKQPVRVRDPHGEMQTLEPNQTTIEPLFAGEYRISSDGTGRTVLANFVDPVESDIGRAGREPPIAATQVRDTEAQRRAARRMPQNDYGRWLYAAALALFGIEWAVARWTGRARVAS
jgi:von Willebrand factor type A domain/Aerotolerance regulator N-terminal